jgi:hypothetical protein
MCESDLFCPVKLGHVRYSFQFDRNVFLVYLIGRKNMNTEEGTGNEIHYCWQTKDSSITIVALLAELFPQRNE